MLIGFAAALLMLVTGGLALLVARHASAVQDVPTPASDRSAPAGRAERIATLVHERVGRTASAVDVLVDPRPADEVLRTPATPEVQRTTYAVMGAGLVGLGAVAAVGVVLLLL